MFAATDGRVPKPDLPIRYSDIQSRRRLARPLGRGEVGCFASHYRLWQRCAELGEPLMILEDDVDIDAALLRVIGELETLVSAHGLIRLSGRPRRGAVLRRTDDGHELVRFRRRLVGTCGYAIAPAAAEKLLAHASRWADPVDEYMDRFWVHGVELVGVTPFPVRQNPALDAGSTIALDRGRKLRGLAKIQREIVRMEDEAQRVWANARAWPRLVGLPRYRPGSAASQR